MKLSANIPNDLVDMDEISSWGKIANALLVAIPSAYISSILAFRKYRTEKWWDRRAQCYCDTIDALNEIIVVCDAFIDEKVHGLTLRKAEKDLLEAKYKKSKEFCFTQINIGKLLMTNEAHEILMSFERELYTLETNSDQAVIKEAIREVTEGHLNAFVPKAKSDLGANSCFWGVFK